MVVMIMQSFLLLAPVHMARESCYAMSSARAAAVSVSERSDVEFLLLLVPGLVFECMWAYFSSFPCSTFSSEMRRFSLLVFTPILLLLLLCR